MTLQQLVESQFVVVVVAAAAAVAIAVPTVVVVVAVSAVALAVLAAEGVVVKPPPRSPWELWSPAWVLHWAGFWHFPEPEHHKMLCV